jgi:lysophospholipase L1-like esterase
MDPRGRTFYALFMPRFARVLLFTTILVAVLLTAELGSRLLVPTELPVPIVAGELEGWLGKREQHATLLWRMTPRRDAEGGIVVNALGLRGPLPGPKAPDELRVLSLGESTTAALRLELGETYSAVLERTLGRQEERAVTVINAGTGGYSLAQGVALARLHTSKLEPDLILTYFGYNDFLPPQFRAERDATAPQDSLEITDRELLRRRAQPWNRALFWLRQHSNFARWAAQRNVPELPSGRRGRGRRVPEADRLALYEELRQSCETRGIRLVVLVPIYRQFNRHQPFLRDLATTHGFEVVDLPTLLGPDLGDRHAYFVDPVHPRANLHARIGNTLAEHLAARPKP